MKNLVIFISLLSIGAFGCHKDSVPNYPVDADLKAAFNFNVGSYWVYLDSISGRIDSFYVSKNIAENDFVTGNPNHTEDVIDIVINEVNINGYSTDVLDWLLIYGKNLIDLNEPKVHSINLGELDYSPFSVYPFDKNLDSDYSVNFTPVINIFSSYQVNGQVFNNVEEINCIKNLTVTENYPMTTPFNSNNWFYLCPNIGFIKIVLNLPQDSINRVWKLQKYKIVQ